MRIAIVQESLDPQRGGAERSTREMGEALADLGQDVTIVTCGSRSQRESRAIGAGQLSLEPLATEGWGKSARTRSFVDDAEAFCATGAFQVVHAVSPLRRCHVYQPRGGVYAGMIERSIALGGNPLERMLKRMGRRLHSRQQFLLQVERELLGGTRPPFVAAVADYVRRQTRRYYPQLGPQRVRVVFNGIALSAVVTATAEEQRAAQRADLGVGAATPMILFVAHNFRLKGLRELLDALALLAREPDTEMRLIVVGRDNARPYQRQARLRGISERVTFLAGVDDPQRLYTAADVLAHPTLYDPCSRVVLEAIAAGLPVLTTSDNGAAELIPEVGAGVVIDDARNIAGLKDGLAACLSVSQREAARAAMGRARDFVSMRRHAQQLIQLYAEASGERG